MQLTTPPPAVAPGPVPTRHHPDSLLDTPKAFAIALRVSAGKRSPRTSARGGLQTSPILPDPDTYPAGISRAVPGTASRR